MVSVMGYVYILDPGFSIDGVSVVKIGTTKRHPNQRIKELQTGNPNKIQLIGYFEFLDSARAEKAIHNQLSQFRLVHGGGGEFFALSPAEAKIVVEKFAHQFSQIEADRQFTEELDKFIQNLIWPSFKIILIILWGIVTFIIMINEMDFNSHVTSALIGEVSIFNLLFLMLLTLFISIPIVLLSLSGMVENPRL